MSGEDKMTYRSEVAYRWQDKAEEPQLGAVVKQPWKICRNDPNLVMLTCGTEEQYNSMVEALAQARVPIIKSRTASVAAFQEESHEMHTVYVGKNSLVSAFPKLKSRFGSFQLRE